LTPRASANFFNTSKSCPKSCPSVGSAESMAGSCQETPNSPAILPWRGRRTSPLPPVSPCPTGPHRSCPIAPSLLVD
jgi:hypothetical protein